MWVTSKYIINLKIVAKEFDFQIAHLYYFLLHNSYCRDNTVFIL